MKEIRTEEIGKIDEKSVLLLTKYVLRHSVAADVQILSGNSMLLTFGNGKKYQLKITETA